MLHYAKICITLQAATEEPIDLPYDFFRFLKRPLVHARQQFPGGGEFNKGSAKLSGLSLSRFPLKCATMTSPLTGNVVLAVQNFRHRTCDNPKQPRW
jgi:hypothetical protein